MFLLRRIRLAGGFMRLWKYGPRETICSAESAFGVTSSPVAAQTLSSLAYLPFPLGKTHRSLQCASESCERAFLLSLASHVLGLTRRALPRVAACARELWAACSRGHGQIAALRGDAALSFCRACTGPVRCKDVQGKPHSWQSSFLGSFHHIACCSSSKQVIPRTSSNPEQLSACSSRLLLNQLIECV